jgi:hypothetical protein
LILSIIFIRLVAWRALDLLARKRRTNSSSSAIFSFDLLLTAIWRSRAMVEASI